MKLRVVILIAAGALLAGCAGQGLVAKAAQQAPQEKAPYTGSIEEMQQLLLDPGVDLAGRESLMEKIDIQKQVEAQKAAAENNRAPKTETGLPAARGLQAGQEIPSGIFEGSEGILKPDVMQVVNFWQGPVQNGTAQVFAGSEPDDANRGLVMVIWTGSDPTGSQATRFPMAESHGALRVVAVEGQIATLMADDGTQWQFDLSVGVFTPK